MKNVKNVFPVFSWGDGDFGKLGRGGSEGCSTPYNIEKLNGVGISQIECGAQVR
jgi:E3 ubiquitin-protein ligase HERC2